MSLIAKNPNFKIIPFFNPISHRLLLCWKHKLKCPLFYDISFEDRITAEKSRSDFKPTSHFPYYHNTEYW